MPRTDPKKPRKEKEPYEWKCPVCKMMGTAATKGDAQTALLVHRMMKGH